MTDGPRCVECDGIIVGSAPKFCSRRCGWRFRNRELYRSSPKVREAAAARYRAGRPMHLRPCISCDVVVVADGRSRRCQPCKDKLGKRFGGQVDLRSKLPTYSSAPRKRMSPSRWALVRAEVLGEEPDCGICGEWINPAALPRTPDHGTVDHIVALADGGSDDRSNLQAAHHGCNSRKEAERRRLAAALRRLGMAA